MAALFLTYLVSMCLIYLKKYRLSILFVFISLALTIWMLQLHMTDKLNLVF